MPAAGDEGMTARWTGAAAPAQDYGLAGLASATACLMMACAVQRTTSVISGNSRCQMAFNTRNTSDP
ncbi:hypothetical protein G6F58_013808 [Rhizopus delemar]|nr:hypothetical protein G6F58_013808 [Rhizopus delemar]